MTKRLPRPPAPGPLEAYAVLFDDLFGTLAQRRGLREFLAGLLLPRDRNKTLTCLAGKESVVGAQHAAVQRGACSCCWPTRPRRRMTAGCW